MLEIKMPTTVLALVPHPDDAEFFCGGTLAKMAQEGARVVIVVASDGQKGSFEHDRETLVAVRAEEARQAAAVLGAEPPILLGHPDLELDRLPPGLLREQFVRLIRQYRPDVVIAEDAFARLEPHPDHRAVAWAASDAINFASLPLVHPEHLAEGLQPHFVVEKYFYSQDLRSANRVVDVTATMERKLAAMAEHRSQVSFLVRDVLQQAHLAGLDMAALAGEATSNPFTLLAWALRSQAAEVGKSCGYGFGEAFRWMRFHPMVEALLEQQSLDVGC